MAPHVEFLVGTRRDGGRDYRRRREQLAGCSGRSNAGLHQRRLVAAQLASAAGERTGEVDIERHPANRRRDGAVDRDATNQGIRSF